MVSYLLQSSSKSQQQTTAVTSNSSVEDDKIIGGKFYTTGKPETGGFSASNSHAASSSADSSRTAVELLGLPLGKTHAESTSAAADNCMDMSVDEQRNFAVEEPDGHLETVEHKSRSGPEGCLLQALTHELMDGSFRDESRSCHGDIISSHSLPMSVPISVPCVESVSSATQNQIHSNGLAKSGGDKKAQTDPVAKPDCLKSIVDKPSVKSVTSATQGYAKSSGLPKSCGDTDAKSKSFILSGVPVSIAEADCLRPVADEPFVKMISSASQNDIESDGLAESSGLVDGRSNCPSMAPVSFSDVAKKAAAPQLQSSRNEINDSYTYRDQSAILISDDDDDDDDNTSDKIDEGGDGIGDFPYPNAGLESGGSEQRLMSEARGVHTLSKMPPESKPQASKSEGYPANKVCEPSKPKPNAHDKETFSRTLPDSKPRTDKSELSSVNKVCQPSTIITIRPPASASSAQSVNGSASNVDMEKTIARRDTISKLLNQKKVCVFIYLLVYLFIHIHSFIYPSIHSFNAHRRK